MANTASEYNECDRYQRQQNELDRYKMVCKPANNCGSVILNSRFCKSLAWRQIN
jgi:hypothetical protein